MSGWYWKNWRTQDNIRGFAKVWSQYGPLGTAVWVVFMLAGLVSLIMVARLVDQGKFPFEGVLCGVASALGAFIYAGLAVASLAHTVSDRLAKIEARLEALESRQADTSRTSH